MNKKESKKLINKQEELPFITFENSTTKKKNKTESSKEIFTYIISDRINKKSR